MLEKESVEEKESCLLYMEIVNLASRVVYYCYVIDHGHEVISMDCLFVSFRVTI